MSEEIRRLAQSSEPRRLVRSIVGRAREERREEPGLVGLAIEQGEPQPNGFVHGLALRLFFEHGARARAVTRGLARIDEPKRDGRPGFAARERAERFEVRGRTRVLAKLLVEARECVE